MGCKPVFQIVKLAIESVAKLAAGAEVASGLQWRECRGVTHTIEMTRC